MQKNSDELLHNTETLQQTIQTLEARCQALEEQLKQRITTEHQQIEELARLYQQVSGEIGNNHWDARNYAFAIYHYLDNIIALVPGHVFWLDRNNTYLGCNNAHAKTANLESRHAIKGKRNADLSWGKHAAELETINNQVMVSGQAIVIEEKVETIYGHQVYLSEKVPLRNENGDIIGLLGTAVDITEHTYINEALTNKNQITQEYSVDTVKEFYKLQEKNKQLKNALDKSLQENQQFRIVQHRETLEFSALYQRVTGQSPQSRLTVRDYALAIYEYLDNIIAAAPGHIFWLDKNNVYLGCNEEHARNLDLISRDFIIGKTNDVLPWREQASTLDEANKQVMSSGKSLVLEEPVRTIYGMRTYLSAKVPLRNIQGEIIGLLGTALDITEQKQALQAMELAKKKAEEASWAKSEFIQNISHDLKTPLTTIMGMAELLAYKEVDSERKERLMMIHRAGKRVVDIFTGILEAASVEASENSVQQQETNIRDIFQGLHELYHLLANEKKLILILQVTSEVPEIIISDPMRLQRILVNLIGNALKFTSAGSVTVKAEWKIKGATHYLVLTVADTGIGIPVDKLELIFEKFVRLTPAYAGTYSGTGLGLGIVKRFVEELGGAVSVESVEGKGAIFTCEIPPLNQSSL